MSTRCQIGFYSAGERNLDLWEALIYRHSDGYPDSECGVIQTILPILRDFDRGRGIDDLEYASAWLVAKLKTDYSNIGISKRIHGDIEFFYAVFSDGMIKTYRTHFGKDWAHWALIDTIHIEDKRLPNETALIRSNQ